MGRILIIDEYSEKRKRPKGFICPCTGVKYHNIQTCLLVYAADSGERLQDHWSSGFCYALGFQKLPGDLANVNEWKIMFDPSFVPCI